MTRKQKLWLYGLIAGFFGGLWASLDSSLVIMLRAPKEFNLDDKLWHTLETMLILGLLQGVKIAVAYLKQAPVPPMNGDTGHFVRTPDGGVEQQKKES